MIIVAMYTCGCRHLGATSGCVISGYDDLVFVIVVWRLFVFRRFEQAKYIRSKTINQINSRQYAIKLESNVF